MCESSTARGVGALSPPHAVRGSTARVPRVFFLGSRGSVDGRSSVAPRRALRAPGNGLCFSVSGSEGALYARGHRASRRPSKIVSRFYSFFREEDGSLERCVSFPKLLNSWQKTVHRALFGQAPDMYGLV